MTPVQLVRDYLQCPESARGAAVAIGNFDGLHPGHFKVLETLKAEALRLGIPPAVLTFEPHPRRFFDPVSPRLRLVSAVEKLRLLRDAGIEIVYMLRFNATLAAMTARAFVEEVLARDLGVRHVVVGEDFHFGRGRMGNATNLTEYADAHAIGTTILPLAASDGTVYASRAIRAALAEGRPRDAAALLGRPFAIDGHVLHGDARGRGMGFPTLNLSLRDRFLPKFGVYAVRVHVAGGAAIQGVANIGVRPTFGGERPVLEAHLFDFESLLYGLRVHVELVAFLREERRFENVEALRAQIGGDCAHAKEILTRVG